MLISAPEMGRPALTRHDAVLSSTIAPVLATAIEVVRVDSLKPDKRKLKGHSPGDIDCIAASIRELGFNNPIVVDQSDTVVAGQGRLAAATRLGLAVVPVIRAAHLTPERNKAYRSADNVLAARGAIDPTLLNIELNELICLDLPFNLEVTGLALDENALDGRRKAPSRHDDDRLPEQPAASVCLDGDIWLLGQYRILCGDPAQRTGWELAGKHRSRGGHHRPRGPARRGRSNRWGVIGVSRCGSSACRALRERRAALCLRRLEAASRGAADGRGERSTHEHLCVWTRPSSSKGRGLYAGSHELVLVLRKGESQLLGRRQRSDLWDYRVEE